MNQNLPHRAQPSVFHPVLQVTLTHSLLKSSLLALGTPRMSRAWKAGAAQHLVIEEKVFSDQASKHHPPPHGCSVTAFTGYGDKQKSTLSFTIKFNYGISMSWEIYTCHWMALWLDTYTHTQLFPPKECPWARVRWSRGYFILKHRLWDFPGGPVTKTPSSQCRGPGFDPWSRN